MDMDSKNYVKDVFPGYGEATSDKTCAKAVQRTIALLSAPNPAESLMLSAANNFYSIYRYDLLRLMHAIVSGVTEDNRLERLEAMRDFQGRYIRGKNA